MKKYELIKLAVLFTLLTLSNACDDSVKSYNGQLEYVAAKSNGCVPDNILLKINDEAQIDYTYANGNLHIDVLFTTLCEAVMKDSVVITGNRIDIFLANGSPDIPRCICPYREEFDFKISGGTELHTAFYFKPNTKNEYYLLAERTISIP